MCRNYFKRTIARPCYGYFRGGPIDGYDSMRFFIDYTAKDRSLYDYQGEEFLSSKDAFEFAEATAQALKNNLNGAWAGWSVEVRNAEGRKYFTLPVDTTQPMAC